MRAIAVAAVVVASSSFAYAEPLSRTACADPYVAGQKLRNAHQLLAARDALRACATSSCAEFIVKDCTEWLAAVESSIPGVILVADDAGIVAAEVRVSMDGAPLVSRIDGHAVEVDPGLHTFLFETEDGRRASTSVVVLEGDKAARVIVTLPERAPPVTTAVIPLPRPTPQPSPPESRSVASGPWKAVGLALVGVGVAGVGVGAGFGIDALIKRNAAGCDSSAPCASSGDASEVNAARRSGNLSTAFLAAGGAATASGLLVWWLVPSASGRPIVGVAANGVNVSWRAVW